jgi:hypothetical protein
MTLQRVGELCRPEIYFCAWHSDVQEQVFQNTRVLSF